jgi:signal transduction histidine kinase
VAAGESAVIRFYQQYTVFSWPWAWRRTVLFGSLGLFAGAIFGASHGLFVRSVWEGIAVSLACGLANVVLVGAGPMIAAFFRHRGWPLRVERALIVAAVIAGIFLGGWADDLAAQYHDHLMGLHGSHSSPKMQPAVDLHLFVRRALDVLKDLLILFIASGGLALPVYFSERKRWAEHWRRVELEKISAQKSESDLRLTVLQAQVEPHFLFNTLASVRSLVTSDPQRAAQTIDALAQHLRATLPKIRAQTGQSQSTLGEQFDICASYLELMKVRLGERLQVELRLPPELRELPFPPLLLISLVENAIKHGAEPKPGATRVTLVARVVNYKLEVTVEDDGAGLTLGMGEGTGLANIRAQLLTRFGTAAQLELLERAYGGVIARLVTPLEPRPA